MVPTRFDLPALVAPCLDRYSRWPSPGGASRLPVLWSAMMEKVLPKPRTAPSRREPPWPLTSPQVPRPLTRCQTLPRSRWFWSCASTGSATRRRGTARPTRTSRSPRSTGTSWVASGSPHRKRSPRLRKWTAARAGRHPPRGLLVGRCMLRTSIGGTNRRELLTAWRRIGWSLLIPFGLVNVAYWTRRLGEAGPAPDGPGQSPTWSAADLDLTRTCRGTAPGRAAHDDGHGDDRGRA